MPLRVRLTLARLRHDEIDPSIPAYLTISIKISFDKRSKVILAVNLEDEGILMESERYQGWFKSVLLGMPYLNYATRCACCFSASEVHSNH